MNFNQILNTLNEKGTAAFDNLNQAGADMLQKGLGAYSRLTTATKEKEKVQPKTGTSTFRKAGSSIPEQIGEYVDTIGDQGAIPIPLSGVHPVARTATGYAKSLAGPLGKPFRVLTPEGTKDFYQDTVNAADYIPGTDSSNGKVIFNQNIENKEAYDRLGGSVLNKDYGRYTAEVKRNGDVIPDDDYDTNRDVGWHARIALTGKDEHGNSKNITDRVISAASAPHRLLTDVGWTNLRPFGREVSIGKRSQK